MEKYKRLGKIELLFFGLGIGYYFGEEQNSREGYLYIFILFVVLAIIGFVMDRRDIASHNEESSLHKD